MPRTSALAVVLMLLALAGSPAVPGAAVQASIRGAGELSAAGRFQVEPDIVFNSQANTIEVKGRGSAVTLPAVSDALRNDSLLEEISRGEWLLKVNLRVFEEVTLELHGRAAGGDVDWLKLKSDPSGYVALEASNGSISIRSTRITSWDAGAGDFDTAFDDGSGRAFVSAKNRSAIYTDNRMDVIDSEVAYLGFFDETAYGISWKVISDPEGEDTGILGRGLTGTISGSEFHHNYFGVYVWGVGDMEVRNNEFYDNFGYGFDAHTLTQRTTVEDNISRDNGLHGIIFAEDCSENVIRRNTVTNNEGHGIMLHESSDHNTIEDNTIIGNDDGVPIFESSNNVIASNIIRENNTGIRVYGRFEDSSDNLFEDNDVSDSRGFGVYMYDRATGNTFSNNRVLGSGDAGFYLSSVSGNELVGNAVRENRDGIRIDSAGAPDSSQGNRVQGNTIENNSEYGVVIYAPEGSNPLEGNSFSGNGIGDVRYPGTSITARGGGRLLLWVGVAVVGAVLLLALASRLLVKRRRGGPHPGGVPPVRRGG